jgi:hypothetical protein
MIIKIDRHMKTKLRSRRAGRTELNWRHIPRLLIQVTASADKEAQSAS